MSAAEPAVQRDTPAGLSSREARERLLRDGPNELAATSKRSILRLVAGVIREPMFALLVAAATVYAAVGDLGEALLLLVFATFSVSIAVIQQGRSDKALAALRDLTSPRALVIRDDQRIRIPGREVVAGDVIVLCEGDRVPADGLLVEGDHVEIDESLLTGESVPVLKRATRAATTAGAPVGEDPAKVFSGTLVIHGGGLARVMATGSRSAVGAIGQSLSSITTEQPRLARETRRMVLVFGAVGLALSVAAFLCYGLLRHSWLDALLGAIALGMALLPEEFPLVLTVFMVMGAWRLSRTRVLTRRAAAIESLGAATVLCTDKTGTLTQNLMSVAWLQSGDERWEKVDGVPRIGGSSRLARLLETAVLASDIHPVDPMERSLQQVLTAAQIERSTADLLRQYPLRADLLAVTNVWRIDGSKEMVVAAKGAPEAIAALCALPAAELAKLRNDVDSLAQRGMRVLAVARGSSDAVSLPESAGGFAFELAGLLGFADPLRESVPDAVRQCRSAGIRVLMITGDHPTTALAIARQAGIEGGEFLTGADLDALDDAALALSAARISVFARIAPVQKLRIISALKAAGEIVAMTGDGVNDAPALKAAHIGIAMGGRGTDVAREAASIVLLDDDFGSIVGAVRLGRRIYDNLRKAMAYILAIHVPIAGLALLPLFFDSPLMLTPMLIALLELIIDPACSVVLEAEREERDVMNRPPRSATSTLLSRSLIGWSLTQGALALTIVAAVFIGALRSGLGSEEVRALTFIALVCANVTLIFVNRTFSPSVRAALGRPNRTLWWGLGIAATIIGSILSWPGARRFFGLGALPPQSLAICLAVAVVLLSVLELLKRAWGRRLLA
ncbi:MAG: cation-translocating P-type ATPase [Pseudomonadota bacterium]